MTAVIIYTHSGEISYDLSDTPENSVESLSEAIAEGSIIINTAVGSALFINADNVCAVEFKEIDDDTPRGEIS